MKKSELKTLIKEIISEISGTFYHGCSNSTDGKEILTDGFLKPGNKTTKKGSKLTPDINRTYVTPNFVEAITYMIGSDTIGSIKKDDLVENGKFGFLFVIDGNTLDNIEPDEDYLGESIFILSKIYGSNKPPTDGFKLEERLLRW